MIASKIVALGAAVALLAAVLVSVPENARGETLEIVEHLTVEAGSTTEWGGGDYIALNMTKGDSLAWFGVVYGNESNPNDITIVSAYIRFLGGAEIRDHEGAMMVPATGIPVLTIYIQKLFALIEFSDDGYLYLWSGDRIGAGNGLFDFENTGDGVADFGIGSVEPVHKMLLLNISWERSEVREVRTLGTTEREWEFTLNAKNLLYDKIWDQAPGEDEDGSRPGREADGKVHDVAFTFHLGTRLDTYNVSVPWYRVTYGSEGVVSSEEAEPRTYEGTSLTTEFKFDHRVKGWDYVKDGNFLMLETGTAFATFVPEIVQEWLDVQFVNATSEEAAGVAEIETLTGGEEDILSTDGIPEESSQIVKDRIVFRDNWQKVGEMCWVSNVTVDHEEEEMRFQIHAGENFEWHEDDEGYVRGIIFIGGYIYPMGQEIYHDPAHIAHALFLEIPVGLDILAILMGIQLAASAVAVCAIAVYAVVRRSKTLF
ncbi:MAG: hypothetical protein AB1665_01185 [Candidatus Thermoplasmatota archaeon]